MRSGRLAKWPMAAILVCTICVTILCILGAALYTARDPTEFSGFADDGDCYTYPFTFGFSGSGCYRGSSSSTVNRINDSEVEDVKSRAIATLALAWLSAGLAIITTINSIFLVLRAKRDRAAQLAANNASYNHYYAPPPAPAQSAYETYGQPPMAQTGAPPYTGGNQYAAPPTTAVI
ncbi:hypothetical protein IE81DRAFT_91333 [Ceraceosorus guamensis]|uniref:Uncharacterized protein n=1 Tax=Ceraceosorus guamensis TaxID=1522189 RepID=A0A316W2X2_9BASI|nr:hypothetical protein IE81DRAFT_91333 [Ceraceosorus guamensis]PWN43448.1 hypothetical protein IE81DRAFT_91333 [Ceraceosorus guamensis]